MDPKIVPQPSVVALLVGTDDMLLYTREAILEKRGFAVMKQAPLKAPGVIQNAEFDVVIACHTLSPEEAQSIAEAAKSAEGAPALIGFTKDSSQTSPAQAYDACIWSLASPEAFIHTVDQVLRSRAGKLRKPNPLPIPVNS